MNHIKGIEAVGMKQNTKEWLDWRHGHIGGSQAAIIKMGNNHPYSSPVLLWKAMTGRVKDEVFDTKQRARMDRGHNLEPIARSRFIQETGIFAEPVCIMHPYYSFAGASLDGMNEERDILVEIKAPGKENHKQALAGQIPEIYYIQMQHQFGVTGAIEGWYVSFDPDNFAVTDQLVVLTVRPDYAFIEDLFRKEYNFMKYVEKDIPPDNDYELVNSLGGLIQIAGFATTGKTETGKVLQRLFSSKRFGYADELKKSAIKIGLVDERIYTDLKYKYKNRDKLVALGHGKRATYPDLWVKGVFNSTTGIYEAMQGVGAFIDDTRYVNEYSYGRRAASRLGVPHRLFWIERPGVLAANEMEVMCSTHLRKLADTIISNDVDFKKHGKEALEMALLAAIGSTKREVKASDFLK